MPAIASIETRVYRIPTDRPEADGTIRWDSTTMLLVEAVADSGQRGLGYSYCAASAAGVVHDVLTPAVAGCPVEQVRRASEAMVAAVRNVGRPGIAACAISAVDVALWDLAACLRDEPLFVLLGAVREAVPVYGSGGFTTYSESELANQLGGWVQQGIPRVKMKIGTDWGTQSDLDEQRVRVAREAIGEQAELYVDANGAYTTKQAIGLAERFLECGVTYFEEPVSSDDLEGLAFVRGRISQSVAAGEYGFDPWYFRHMLQAGAVDILQADATRCLGLTGWLEAASLAHGFGIPFSAHTSPSIHAQAGCAAPQLSHVEYFHDHVRIEHLLFDGVLEPTGGCLRPDCGRPGLGLELKAVDAERWRVA
ncbi:MAG: mandelate racemase [Chloroflexota bacterium]|nr:mandelate racemase [Chloroflexota bacterium]